MDARLQAALDHTTDCLLDPVAMARWKTVPGAPSLRVPVLSLRDRNRWQMHRPLSQLRQLPSAFSSVPRHDAADGASDRKDNPNGRGVFLAFRYLTPTDPWWVRAWCEAAGITAHHVEILFRAPCGGPACALRDSYRATGANPHRPGVMHVVSYTASSNCNGEQKVLRSIDRLLPKTHRWTLYRVACTLPQQEWARQFLDSRLECAYDWWSALYAMLPLLPPPQGVRCADIMALRRVGLGALREPIERVAAREAYTCSSLVMAALLFAGVVTPDNWQRAQHAVGDDTADAAASDVHAVPCTAEVDAAERDAEWTGLDPCATLPHDLLQWCASSREVCAPTLLDAVRTVRDDESARYHAEREHNPWAVIDL